MESSSNDTSIKKKESKAYLVHYAVVFVFCIFFRFLPPFGGLTTMGMGVLGSFIGVIYGWMAIGMLGPSLIALIGIGLSVGTTNVLASGFGAMVVVALIFFMPIVYVCNDTGAFNYLIDKMLTSKLLQGRPWMTILMLFLVSWLFSCVNIVVITLIVCDFARLIFDRVGIEKNEKVAIFTFLGISFSCMVGQVMFPFMGMGLVLLSAFNTMFPDAAINFSQYMLFMIPMSLLMVLSFLFFMKTVFRVDVSKIAAYESDKEVGKATKDQKKALAIFLAFVVLAIWCGLRAGVVGKVLALMTLAGIIFALLVIMMLMHRENGDVFCDVEEGMKTNNWGLNALVAVIMVVSTYMNNSETGIPAAISAMLQPFTSLSPILFVVAILLIALLLTNVANNLVIIVLIMPIAYNYALLSGISPTAIMALLFVMTQFALITPAASPSTAIAMSQSKYVDANKMTVAALKAIPLLFVFGLLVGWLLSSLIFF